MSNTIQTKRGSGKPDGKLAPYELGIDIDNGQLYFGGELVDDGSENTIKRYGDSQAIVAHANIIVDEKGDKKQAGSATTPIYLDKGEFKNCGDSISGTIDQAKKLVNSRKIGVKLDSDTFVSFNGQQDIETGTQGILPISKGGTGVSGEVNLKKLILNMCYPVGSIYTSTVNNSPSNFLGGNWEQIEGRFLLSASKDYPAGEMKGEAKHKLTVEEMPKHQHRQLSLVSGYDGWDQKTIPQYSTHIPYDSGFYVGSETLINAAVTGANVNTDVIGGDQSHNNMPPYLAVYMWKRIK